MLWLKYGIGLLSLAGMICGCEEKSNLKEVLTNPDKSGDTILINL